MIITVWLPKIKCRSILLSASDDLVKNLNIFHTPACSLWESTINMQDPSIRAMLHSSVHKTNPSPKVRGRRTVSPSQKMLVISSDEDVIKKPPHDTCNTFGTSWYRDDCLLVRRWDKGEKKRSQQMMRYKSSISDRPSLWEEKTSEKMMMSEGL